MADRHIRRNGSDYGDAFMTLLPQGQAWPKRPGTTLDLACRGLTYYWGDVDRRAADLLEQESDPRTTQELLPDWERAWGLPDPCYEAPQSIGQRQQALVMRMTMLGAQSREFFIGVAKTLGYTITITEYRTFVVGMDGCGDCRVFGDGVSNPMYNKWGQPILNDRGTPIREITDLSEYPYYGLGPETNRFYWTVHVTEASIIWFRVGAGGGQTGIDPHVRIGYADDLECLLNRWKPAHTQIIFDYSNLGPPPNLIVGDRFTNKNYFYNPTLSVPRLFPPALPTAEHHYSPTVRSANLQPPTHSEEYHYSPTVRSATLHPPTNPTEEYHYSPTVDKP